MIIQVRDLRKYFPVRRSWADILRGRSQRFIKAVNGLNFDVRENEVFCLAGESGCGKSTTGRLLIRLLEPTSGKVLFKGRDIYAIPKEKFKEYRKYMQIIFQDPYESLNPRMTVYDLIEEPLRIHNIGDEKERFDLVYQALMDVGLEPPEDFMIRYPHQLSGGQRQRVAIARALILKPEFVVADEPVSMLDVSIRAGILKLMLDLKEKYGLTYLFITHDLSVAYHMCDRLAVMYLGKIVEMGPAEDVILSPLHPYTKALVEAVPKGEPELKDRLKEVPIIGDVPSPIDLPTGCIFSPRCVKRFDLCDKEEPLLLEVGNDRYVACHLFK
ncbi:MAG TPA: ABC transporter ATP-binding protein [Candidatus Korarchaeota archaeon]|nr:ABC transporter ATP-binding protein [Candidatus Korarchaeota archaeon]